LTKLIFKSIFWLGTFVTSGVYVWNVFLESVIWVKMAWTAPSSVM
jgi:hypothetical protein